MSEIQCAIATDSAATGDATAPTAEDQVLVADVMTTCAPAVPPWLTMAAARKIAQLKSAPNLIVAEQGRLIGVLCAADLLAAPDQDIVGAWTRMTAVSLHAGTAAPRARHLMIKNGVSCLPVVAGNLLVGVITRDALERATARARGRGISSLLAPAPLPQPAPGRAVAA